MGPGFGAQFVNPILQEIDQKHSELSPSAQRAIAMSGVPQSAIAPQLPDAPTPSPIAMPSMARPLGSFTSPVSPPAPPPPITSSPTPASQHAAELNRLTTGETGKSGIDQIKSPAIRTPLKVLSTLGSVIAPGLASQIPGTQLHHNALVSRETGLVNEDEKLAADQATREHTGAETAELGQRGAEAAARANKLGEPPEKLGDPSKTIETADGIMQFNPETQKYDVPVGQAPGKSSTEHVVASDGSVIAIHTNAKTGETTHEIVYKGDPKVPTEITTLQINGKPHQVVVNKETGKTIQDLGEKGAEPKVPADHGVTMIGPDGKVLRLEPGQTAPSGTQTSSGFSSLNTPTTQQRNVAAQASLVHEQTPMMLQEIDRLKDKLGPMAGRWNEFMQGKVGAVDPEMAGLRADLLMYSSAVALMHARGRLPENLREEFDRAINAPKQSAENLKAIISKIDQWTSQNMKAMGSRSGQEQSNAPKSGDIVDGYKFKGGDPGKQENWVKQ